MFSTVRYAMQGVAPMDAFYVAFYGGPQEVILPYVWMRDGEPGSDFIHYTDTSLSAWMAAHRRIYHFDEDDGACFRAAAPLRDGATPTLDAVAVPLHDRDRELIGFVCTQSDAPDVYDDTGVHALQWLTRALARALEHAEEDEHDLALLERQPELDAQALGSAEPALDLSRRFEELRELTQAIEQQLDTGDLPGARLAVQHLHERCLAHQTATTMTLVATPVPDDWDRLTPRQREIARLIVDEDLSNAQLAERLVISEATVKSHVSAALRSLCVASRQDLRELASSHMVKRG